MFWTILISLIAIYLIFDWLIRVFKVGNYSNKHVFVTGCDSGFGRELVIRLDSLGFPVFAGCYTEDGRRSLKETCSSRVEAFPLDVTSDASILDALAVVRRKIPDGNGLWAVVNNAGVIGQVVAAEICSKKEYQACYDVNLIGAIEVSRAFMPFLRKSKGRLVNLTSCMGRCAAEAAPYCVSKFGLEAFTDVIRKEVAQFGVKVSLVEPGYTRTGLFHVEEIHQGIRDAYSRSDPEVQAAYGKKYPEQVIAVLTGKLKRLSPNSYKVVDALAGAITSVYPRPRYVVGYDAKFWFIPLTFVPEWISDRLFIASDTNYAKENGFVFQ